MSPIDAWLAGVYAPGVSRRRIGIVFGGVVAFGLALLLRRPAVPDDGPAEVSGSADSEERIDAGPRWADGRPVERPELYPAQFEFEEAAFEVELPEDITPLEAELCHPLARALCEAREACGCATEERLQCEERERALCRRSLACGFLGASAPRTLDRDRLRQCLAEARDDLRRCRDAPLPEVCFRVAVAPVELGQPCPPDASYCRGGVCADGRCRPEPDVGEPCLRVRTPGALPEESWVCRAGAICQPQPDGSQRCMGPELSEGMPCEASRGCPADQACVEGRCGPPRQDGEPCEDRDACDGQLTCRGGVCVPARRCVHYEDCGHGQTCHGERRMRCLPPPGAKLGEPCRTSRSCARGLVCVAGFCEEGPGPGEPPVDGRCGVCCLAPRGPGGCLPKRVRGRGERCDGRRDRCDEGLACVPRTALDGGLALRGFECVTGLGEGAECVPGASRCRTELDCRAEYRGGRCLSTLCISAARLWSCEGAPTRAGDYGALAQPAGE